MATFRRINENIFKLVEDGIGNESMNPSAPETLEGNIRKMRKTVM